MLPDTVVCLPGSALLEAPLSTRLHICDPHNKNLIQKLSNISPAAAKILRETKYTARLLLGCLSLSVVCVSEGCIECFSSSIRRGIIITLICSPRSINFSTSYSSSLVLKPLFTWLYPRTSTVDSTIPLQNFTLKSSGSSFHLPVAMYWWPPCAPSPLAPQSTKLSTGPRARYQPPFAAFNTLRS